VLLAVLVLLKCVRVDVLIQSCVQLTSQYFFTCADYHANELVLLVYYCCYDDDDNDNEKALRETQALRARRTPPIDAKSPR